MKCLIVSLGILFICHLVHSYEGTITEELLIKPLYSEQVYTHFQFSTKWDIDPDKETCKYSYYCRNYI